MKNKRKLKIGDKVTKTVGCSYGWNDRGTIKWIKRKKINLYEFEEVAGVLIQKEIQEICLCNLQKIRRIKL